MATSSLGFIGTGIAGCNRPETQPGEDSARSLRIKEYRTLGRTGYAVSDISAGTFNQNPALLDALLKAGVNYIDTSEYYGEGREERSIGEVIKRHDRKSLFITDKLFLSRNRTKEDILARVRGCLERLQTDYIDCMMIAAVQDIETSKCAGFHEAMDQLKREGRIRFVGLSSHGTQKASQSRDWDQVLPSAVNDGRFDVFLLIYNFIARDLAEKVLETCTEKGIGVTLMKTNPVNHYQWGIGEEDGSYLSKLKDDTDDFAEKYELKNAGEIRDAAIRFVLSNKHAHSVCVSFHNFDEVKAYLLLSGGRLTEADSEKLAAYELKRGHFYCRHDCGACEPHCPDNVPVNTIMRFNHYFEAQGREKHALVEYAKLETPRADLCRNCVGYCEQACPHHVPIRGLLTRAHESLSLA
jgi:predicted aldo/keto reductase-like oxidoreductase